MNDLAKIKIARIIASARFWIATFVLYLITRGISIEQAFQILSIYYISIVIFEYPTGVFADYHSHKLSVILGYVIVALAFILISFSDLSWYYISVFIFYALGGALISGSDNALIHDASENFKDDYAQVKANALIVTVAAISIGGFVSAIDLRYPLYLTALAFLAAAAFLVSVKISNKEKTERSFWGTGVAGLKQAVKNQNLFHLLVASTLIGALFFSIKWIYNPLFMKLNINVSLWGILISGATLLIAAGTRIYKKFSSLHIYLVWLMLIISLLAIGLTNLALVSMVGLFLSHLVRGYLETKLKVEINKNIKEAVRASVFSFEGLLVRLGSSAYIFMAGIIIKKTSIFTLMAFSILLLIVLGSYSIFKIRQFEKLPTS